jgi:glucokinase
MNIIGLDVGGTKILGVRTDEHGRVLDRVRRPTGAGEGEEAVMDRIAETIRELTPPEGVDGIGVGMPGPLDPVAGVIYEPPNLPGWDRVPFFELLDRRLGEKDKDRVPVALVKDTNAAALAEYRFGAGHREREGRPVRHLVYLSLGTGVGGGVIVDGKLLIGSGGIAGELGHIIVDLYGPRCPCGNIGCLEAMAPGPALAREAAMMVASRRETSMAEAVGGDPDKVTAEIVIQAAQQGDPAALELMEREAKLVGAGIISLVHIFNPQLVVLGGGVANAAGELLLKPVRAAAETHYRAFQGTFDVVLAALGGDSGALGAVAAALEKVEGKT